MMSSRSLTDTRPVTWVAAFTALSWAGEYAHNRFELPALGVLSPENSGMALVAVLLFLLWWALPARRFPAVLLLSLGLLHLIGGAVLSVLPLPILPYDPEQSLSHYLAHLAYGLAQVPLIVAMVYQLRRARRPAVDSPTVPG